MTSVKTGYIIGLPFSEDSTSSLGSASTTSPSIAVFVSGSVTGLTGSSHFSSTTGSGLLTGFGIALIPVGRLVFFGAGFLAAGLAAFLGAVRLAAFLGAVRLAAFLAGFLADFFFGVAFFLAGLFAAAFFLEVAFPPRRAGFLFADLLLRRAVLLVAAFAPRRAGFFAFFLAAMFINFGN